MKKLKLIPITFLLFFFYWPLVNLIKTLNFRKVGVGPRFKSELVFTILQATGSTLLFLLLVLLASFLLFFVRDRWLRFLAWSLLIPFFLPIIAIAQIFQASAKLYPWHFIFTHNSTFNILLANSLFNLGFGTFYLDYVIKSINPEISDLAKIEAVSNSKIYFKILLPSIFSDLFILVALIFNFSLTDLGSILTFGSYRQNTIESAIYQDITLRADVNQGISLALAQMLLIILSIIFIKGKNIEARSNSLNLPSFNLTWKMRVFAYSFYIFWSFPILYFIGNSLLGFFKPHPTGMSGMFNVTFSQAVFNSLRNAFLATFISVILTGLLLLSYRKLNSLIIWSIGFSPAVLALAALVTFSRGIFPLRDSWLITPIYEGLIYFPILYLLLYPNWHAINPEYLAECEIAGGDILDRFRYIYFPLLKREIFSYTLVVFLISMSDFIVPNFLSNGKQSTLTVLLYQLYLHPNSYNSLLISKIIWFLLVLAILLLGLNKLVVQDRFKRLIHQGS